MFDRLEQAQVYTDFQGLAKLRAQAGRDSAGALEKVTRQFEAYFLQQMLKSARAASFGDSLFQSSQGEFFQGMYDQQLSLNVAGNSGLGLAKVLREQIEARFQMEDDEVSAPRMGLPAPRQRRVGAPVPGAGPAGSAMTPDRSRRAGTVEPDKPFASPADFVQRLLPLAERTAGELGVDPRVLVAQAALETGWGRSVIRRDDGVSSHNLFGIKADGRWRGETARAHTLEYDQGTVTRRHETFRAYDSFADSFSDYLAFVRDNPRYGEALVRAADPRGFVEGLQQAGYATDPKYAEKILAILEGESLRRPSG